MKTAYHNLFRRVGIGDQTYLTFASGGTFAKYSHEFQAVSDAGEDIIYVDESKNIAINEEVLSDEVLADIGLSRSKLVQKKSIEVGNIFSLAHKFSEPFGLAYTDKDGATVPVFMGSYGIGITRLMGTIVEMLSDDKGIIWPEAIAPYKVYLVSIGEQGAVEAERLYDELTARGVEVLFDDRDERPGTKFADAELMGIPYRLTVSDRLVEQNKLELTKRLDGQTSLLTASEVLAILD